MTYNDTKLPNEKAWDNLSKEYRDKCSNLVRYLPVLYIMREDIVRDKNHNSSILSILDKLIWMIKKERFCNKRLEILQTNIQNEPGVYPPILSNREMETIGLPSILPPVMNGNNQLEESIAPETPSPEPAVPIRDSLSDTAENSIPERQITGPDAFISPRENTAPNRNISPSRDSNGFVDRNVPTPPTEREMDENRIRDGNNFEQNNNENQTSIGNRVRRTRRQVYNSRLSPLVLAVMLSNMRGQ